MLTTQAFSDQVDLSPWVGQRSAIFTFRLVNGVTGENLGEINPIRGSAQLTHDISRTIKRQLSMALGVADTARVEPISGRVDVSMTIANVEYPLGRYMFIDFSKAISTGGDESVLQLTDEMFLVDQQITTPINGLNVPITATIQNMLADLPITVDVEISPYVGVQSWAIGDGRGQILESLALTGDYFSPWFGNDQKFHMIRAFNPDDKVPAFDFDAGNQVIRDPITHTDNLLTAPNRFIVISNASTDPTVPVFASVDVPPTAPHSIPNRGFVIPEIQTLPVANNVQAAAVANNLALRQSVFENVVLSTAPDPRHDSYDVIVWQGENWLEISWSMSMTEGAAMTHALRKVYSG